MGIEIGCRLCCKTVLIYAAGCWTASKAKIKGSLGSENDTVNGWTIGVSVDDAFTDNIVGRLECRCNDFGKGDLLGANVDF